MKELLELYENKQPEIVFNWKDSETEAEGWTVINSLRGGAAGGGGGWWGGNATFSVSTSSDDTDQLGGGSHSMNSHTDNGTHSGDAGSVALTL